MQANEMMTALKALNSAAHNAIRAGKDTEKYPMLHRAMLREIAGMTDDLVDFQGNAKQIDEIRENRNRR